MLRQLLLSRNHELSKTATSFITYGFRRRFACRTMIPNNHRLLLSSPSSSLADLMITYNDGVTSDNSFSVVTTTTPANAEIMPPSSSSCVSSIQTETTTATSPLSSSSSLPMNETTLTTTSSNIIIEGDDETNNNNNTIPSLTTPPPLPPTTTTTLLQEQMKHALSSSQSTKRHLNDCLRLFHQSQSYDSPLGADNYRTLLSRLLSSKPSSLSYVNDMMAIVMDYHRYYGSSSAVTTFTDEEYLAIIDLIYPLSKKKGTKKKQQQSQQSQSCTHTTQSFYHHIRSLPIRQQSLYLSHWLLSIVRCPEYYEDMERAGSGIWRYVKQAMSDETKAEWIVEGEVLSEILAYSYKRGRGVVYHEILEELVHRGYSPKPWLVLHLLENTILHYHHTNTPLASIPSILTSLLTLQKRHNDTSPTTTNPYTLPPSLIHASAISSPTIAIPTIHLLFDICDVQRSTPTVTLYELAMGALASRGCWREVVAIVKEMEREGGCDVVGRRMVMSLGRYMAKSTRCIDEVYDIIRYGDDAEPRYRHYNHHGGGSSAVPFPIPSLSLMNVVLAGCAMRGDVDRAFATFHDCHEWGIKTNDVTMELLIKCLATCEEVTGEEYDVALELMESGDDVKKSDDDDDDDGRQRRKKRINGYLAEMLRKDGRLDDAAKIDGGDVVSLLQTYLRRGDYDKMETFLKERATNNSDDGADVVLPDWFKMRWERVRQESRQKEKERLVSSDAALPPNAEIVIQDGSGHDSL